MGQRWHIKLATQATLQARFRREPREPCDRARIPGTRGCAAEQGAVPKVYGWRRKGCNSGARQTHGEAEIGPRGGGLCPVPHVLRTLFGLRTGSPHVSPDRGVRSSGIVRPIRSSDRHSSTWHPGTRRLSIRVNDRQRHHHVIHIVGDSLVPCSQATKASVPCLKLRQPVVNYSTRRDTSMTHTFR